MFRSGPGRRLDSRRMARLSPAGNPGRAAALRRLTFAPARIFRRAASRAELIRSRCHPAFCVAELFRRLAVLRQHFFELLFDAQGIDGGARPEFPQRMAVALAPSDQSLMVFPALAEEGDDVVSELAEGRGVEPIDDEGTRARRDAQRDRRGAVRCQMLEIQSAAPEIYRRARRPALLLAPYS